ncbi:MAG: TIGR02281 family clan AA aspartic protease [bacterium]
MKEIPFTPSDTLVGFECRIEYKGIAVVWMALDTGASRTIIPTEVLRNIGFQEDSLKNIVSFGDASQTHLAPIVKLPSFSVGNATVSNLEALAYTLPEKLGIDGLIGLNFLQYFKKFTVDFEESKLLLYEDV